MEAAGSHRCCLRVIGRLEGAPFSQLGLVLPLIPPDYFILGNPPSFATVTRDTYPVETFAPLPLEAVRRIVFGIASVCTHLHARRISHGDLYAHNILVDRWGNPILSDFGASSFYDYRPCLEEGMEDIKASLPEASSIHPSSPSSSSLVPELQAFFEGIEVRAFGCLLQDLLGRLEKNGSEDAEEVPVPVPEIDVPILCEEENNQVKDDESQFNELILTDRNKWLQMLQSLQNACFHPDPLLRPPFSQIVERLQRVAISPQLLGGCERSVAP